MLLVMDGDSDENEVISQSWNKIAKSLHKEGYREGLSAGRDLTFQQGFDSGYLQGFQNGYKLGLHNGLLRFLNSEQSTLDSTLKGILLSGIESVERPYRGYCIVCSEEGNPNDSTSKNLPEVIEMQSKLINDWEKLVLTEKYSSLLRETKLNELFDKLD